jgi:glycerophosphoryl diester phosphodiesterase
VIAHRGASAYLPENTLPAYALAVEQRADMIEIDLHRSRDGAIVIAHDADLTALGGEGAIGERTLAELRALSAGGDEGLKIPTLEEVLDGFGQASPFNLELKGGPKGPYPGLEAQTLEVVESRGLLERTIFSSFDDSILAEIRRISAAARLAVLVDIRQPELDKVFDRARNLVAEAVNPHFLLANADLIGAAHSAGLAVYAYTVDDPGQMRDLIDAGIDGLFTNCPDRMRAVIDEGAGGSTQAPSG